MTEENEPTNGYNIRKEAEKLAIMIIEEYPDDIPDGWRERVHETVDGHQWVIYYGQADEVARNAIREDRDEAEEWLEGIYGSPFAGADTLDEVNVRLSYAVLYTLTSAALEHTIECFEATE